MSDLQIVQERGIPQEKRKRQTNGFLIFRNEINEIYKDTNIPMKVLSKIVSDLWNNMPESQKNEYKREYELNRENQKNSKNMFNEIIDLCVQVLQLRNTYEGDANILNLKKIIINKIEEYIDNAYQSDEKTPDSLLEVYFWIYLHINNNMISFKDFLEWHLEL
ncbi:hypothetical protein RclHR1_01070015 [Rhizophagus clarus]|uniref:HMG box domain-containing protein n=1 Tax=Rhizophagus clarus TaxID=94130 RepID=A0A2Z6Q3V1_9GLOM|nr:hypothetical protein RclHR1_01070015 [Rhizophagus clarus]GET04829.1 hypothetical protein GLOIN_2v1789545 [Rhizophagus clarus]